jgi:hypothetical protein
MQVKQTLLNGQEMKTAGAREVDKMCPAKIGQYSPCRPAIVFNEIPHKIRQAWIWPVPSR